MHKSAHGELHEARAANAQEGIWAQEEDEVEELR